MTLADIPRNDIPATLRFYQERGKISVDTYRVLWRLQDNPEAFEKASKDWEIRKPGRLP